MINDMPNFMCHDCVSVIRSGRAKIAIEFRENENDLSIAVFSKCATKLAVGF